MTRITDKPNRKAEIKPRTEVTLKNACVFLALLLVPRAYSQVGQAFAPTPGLSESSVFVGADLRLGMERDDVLTKLKAFYKLIKMQTHNDNEQWMIRDSSVDKTPLPLIGTVKFRGGKLTYVSRRWSRGDEDNFEFAQLLRAAMEQIGKEGHHNCRFTIPTDRTPAAEFTYVDLHCGPKMIEIGIVDVSNGEAKGHYVSIDEVLTLEEN